jgi:hypothetical protein
VSMDISCLGSNNSRSLSSSVLGSSNVTLVSLVGGDV